MSYAPYAPAMMPYPPMVPPYGFMPPYYPAPSHVSSAYPHDLNAAPVHAPGPQPFPSPYPSHQKASTVPPTALPHPIVVGSEPPPRRTKETALVHLRALERLATDGDYFELLGIPRGASTEAIAAAREVQLARIPVDAFDDEVRPTAIGVVAAIEEAYEVLCIPELRAAYARNLS